MSNWHCCPPHSRGGRALLGLESPAVDVALSGGLVGVVASLWVASLDRRSRARKAVAAAARTRAAIAADMQIHKELPADSPAAAQLDAVIQLRLNGYLGPPPLRLGNAAVFLLLLGAAVTWMVLELGSAKTTGTSRSTAPGWGSSAACCCRWAYR